MQSFSIALEVVDYYTKVDWCHQVVLHVKYLLNCTWLLITGGSNCFSSHIRRSLYCLLTRLKQKDPDCNASIGNRLSAYTCTLPSKIYRVSSHVINARILVTQQDSCKASKSKEQWLRGWKGDKNIGYTNSTATIQ
jgi:hypothetical protein